MERVMGGGLLKLVLGSAGVFLLYRILLRLRPGAALQDAVVVITGASSGLGKECARVFHAAGARLVLCGRDAVRLQQVVQELAASSTGSQRQTYTPSTVIFDLADTDSVDRAAEEILKCYGQVDVLINNAGISYRGNILGTHISVQREVMETNYFGPIALTQALLPSMVRRRSGHIVVISSVQGKIAIPYRSAYEAGLWFVQTVVRCSLQARHPGLLRLLTGRDRALRDSSDRDQSWVHPKQPVTQRHHRGRFQARSFG
ncbi:dehydrogenase/reductase SDR family member 7B isoform X2 [Chaetodon trifascialis]|uniref:dehydrogenase/reductase SDR family member 7B isoform X2 n=1 Tax=Chaetodon trifascialis TaxID=109706 RepID=UPI003996B19E